MRKTVVLLFVLLLAAPMIHASDSSFSLFGSWWSEADPGDVYGFGIRYTTQNGPWALDLGATWLDDSTYYYYGWDVYYHEAIQTIPLEIGFRYISQSYNAFRPYVGAGGGYYLNDSDYAKIDDSWGYYGLVGFNFGSGNGADFFAEGIYRWVDTDVTIRNPAIGPPAVTNVDLGGFGINMGVVFHF